MVAFSFGVYLFCVYRNQACDFVVVDILFLLDDSASIDDDEFSLQINWVTDVMSKVRFLCKFLVRENPRITLFSRFASLSSD